VVESSLCSDVSGCVVVRKLLYLFYFQHRIWIIITISLNIQVLFSGRLHTQGVTYPQRCTRQLPCYYPANSWDLANIYKFWATIRLLFATLPLFAVSSHVSGSHFTPGHCLQFVGWYPATVWHLATVYNLWDDIRLLFGTWPLFTICGMISGYCLGPGHCLQVLGASFRLPFMTWQLFTSRKLLSSRKLSRRKCSCSLRVSRESEPHSLDCCLLRSSDCLSDWWVQAV
jgi:hypothetical protein